jgi:hypothetical protein
MAGGRSSSSARTSSIAYLALSSLGILGAADWPALVREPSDVMRGPRLLVGPMSGFAARHRVAATRTVHTAIWKRAVAGPCRARRTESGRRRAKATSPSATAASNAAGSFYQIESYPLLARKRSRLQAILSFPAVSA